MLVSAQALGWALIVGFTRLALAPRRIALVYVRTSYYTVSIDLYSLSTFLPDRTGVSLSFTPVL